MKKLLLIGGLAGLAYWLNKSNTVQPLPELTNDNPLTEDNGSTSAVDTLPQQLPQQTPGKPAVVVQTNSNQTTTIPAQGNTISNVPKITGGL